MARDELTGPDVVVIWCPPAGEHELARSLGLVEHDRATVLAWVRTVREEFGAVRVLKCRCWRVVRALQVLGLTNTSENRAVAYGYLVGEAENDGGDARRHGAGR